MSRGSQEFKRNFKGPQTMYRTTQTDVDDLHCSSSVSGITTDKMVNKK